MNRSPKRSLFFYQDDKLLTRLQGDEPCSLFRMGDITLAERNVKGTASTLLASDIKGSTFGTEQADANHSHAYTPYGFCAELYSLLGFNGEYFDRVLGGYLPHSYRIYNSRLMRFHSTDDLSPFLKGGLNPYTFCSGDPINYTDPTGHTRQFNIKSFTYIETSTTKTSVKVIGPSRKLVITNTTTIDTPAIFHVYKDKTRTDTVPVLEYDYPKYKQNEDLINTFEELDNTYPGREIIMNQYIEAAAKNTDKNGSLTRPLRTFSPEALVQDAKTTNALFIANAKLLLKRNNTRGTGN